MTDNIPITGEGILGKVMDDFGLVPFANLPLLKKIPFIGRKISFESVDGTSLGGIKLPMDEMILGVVQSGKKAMLLSYDQQAAGGDYVVCKYFLRETNDLEDIVAPDFHFVGRFSTSTSPPTLILDLVYNGQENVPMVIFNHPKSQIGHRGALCLEYSPIESVNLVSKERKILTEHASHLKLSLNDSRRELSFILPASKVSEYVDEYTAKPLAAIFDPEDLKLVEAMNNKNDQGHLCYGNQSCIDAKTFEFIYTKGYPRYEVRVDANGKAYSAKRIAPHM